MLATERNQETTKNVQENFIFFLLSKRRDRLPPKKEDDRQLAIYNKAKEHLYTHNTPINFEKGKKKEGKKERRSHERKKEIAVIIIDGVPIKEAPKNMFLSFCMAGEDKKVFFVCQPSSA